MTTNIRLAIPRDHAVCAQIFLRSRIAGFHWILSSRFDLGDFEPSILDEELWVAEREGRIVGFASIFLEEDFLHNLFVDPDVQRAGVGSLLLEKFIQRTKRPSLLKCLSANHAALAFYQKHGWEKMERGEEEFGQYWLLIKR